ncbi:MAG TPA: Dyp-type peroxidase [Streptosporangiaceae bacterium]|nr:Dyp-type peroxidase [Streptosporangiaceae bacterium]
MDGASGAEAAGPDPEPQAVLTPLTEAAIFLVAVAGTDATPPEEALPAIRDLYGDLAGLIRAVGTREPRAYLTCVAGIGHRLWDRLGGERRPAGLHEFREFRAPGRHAVSTPGDLLFHIRAARMDLCYELASQIMFRAGRALTVLDEVHGFRYFDNRDVIGFVDGTENPVGAAAQQSVLIGAEDGEFAGGSYVIVQKYLHDLAGWNALPTEQQEGIIGRYKLSDIEQTDDVKPSFAHNALTTILDADGEEVQIVRDNMPFGTPGRGEYGTYFIGYSRSPDTTEQMMQNMFIGSPEGNYDRLLDFSTAVTGGLFFVPSQPLLERLADGPLDDRSAPAAPVPAGEPVAAVAAGAAGAAGGNGAAGPRGGSGSLEIGSMKGTSRDE